MKKIIAALIIILVVISAGVAALFASGVISSEKSISGETAQFELNKLGFLETYEYHYTHIQTGDNGENKFGFLKIPASKFIYSCDGVIIAGIDFEKIKVERTDYVYTVTLPKAEIKRSSSGIDMKSFKMYDEKNNIFNPYTIEDVVESFEDMESFEENSAIEKGLLDKANENAETLIENLLKGLIPDEYEDKYKIEFADAQ